VKAYFLKPLLAGDPERLRLLNARNGQPVATSLEPAFDSGTRRRGLLGRNSLPPQHALIIAPSNMVHTFFMRFPIDVLIASRDGRVLKVRENVPAHRIVGAFRGFAVIEMAAHELRRSGIAVGDRLVIEP
jgi:uncharacterized membrane protein (UPF0127 family)